MAFSATCHCLRPCFCLVVLSLVSLTITPRFRSNTLISSCPMVILSRRYLRVNMLIKIFLEVLHACF
nr:MAG TPA: hypothetical protein [Bacteriophage sp.]